MVSCFDVLASFVEVRAGLKVRKIATSVLKQHCYYSKLLMQTKTAVCLQTKAIFHHPYGFLLVF